MNGGEILAWTAAALDAAAIPYMIVGSFASSAFGQPRTTMDLDVVIEPTNETLARFLDGLDPDRFYVDREVAIDALRRRGMFNVIDSATGWKVDFVIRKATAHAVEELGRRIQGVLLGVQVMVATPEDVILAKLGWAKDGGSQRQLEDVANILAARRDQLDRAYLERWIERAGADRCVGPGAARGVGPRNRGRR